MKKKFVFILIFSAALVLPFFAGISRAYAEELLTPEIFNFNTKTKYGYLDNPTALSGNGEFLYFALSGGGALVYQNNELSQSFEFNADKFTVYREKNVWLEGSVLHYGEQTIQNVKDFSFQGDILRTTDGDNITVYNLNDDAQLASGTTYAAAGKVDGLAENCDFYYVNEGTSYDAHTIYALNEGKNSVVVELPYTVKRVMYAFGENSFYFITSDSIIKYTANSNSSYYFESASKNLAAKDFTLSENDVIYALTNYSSVIAMASDFTDIGTVIASASDIDYFYNRPSSVSARFGNIIVSDRMNNRLAIINENGISYIKNKDIVRPVDAALDSENNIIALTSVSLLKLTLSGEVIYKTEVIGGTQLVVNSDDTVYVNIDGEVKKFTLTASDNSSQNDNENADDQNNGTLSDGSSQSSREAGEIINAESIAPCNGYLTYYDGENITENGRIIFSSEGITSYAFDIEKRIFYIKDGALYRYDGENTKLAEIDGKIIISGIKTSFIDYGDALIVNPDRHCVYRLTRNQIGSGNIEDIYKVPEFGAEADASVISDNIIVYTVKNAKLFKTPAESEIITDVPKNTYLIINYEVKCPEQFLYVLYDDLSDEKLKGGYIYKSSLDIPLAYELPAVSVAKINADNRYIYKWPSVNSPTVKGIIKKRNETISIIDFAITFTDEYAQRWFQDVRGKKWYRTKIDDTHEGFILAADVTTQFFSGDKMPDTNASITDYALLYHYDSSLKKYVAIDETGMWVAKGTRVRVETPFDSSQKYTKIIFYRDGYGTIDIDCYVETKYIDYDGIDLLQFIAILIICATLLLAVILIIRHVKVNKKKNLIKAKDEEKTDM